MARAYPRRLLVGIAFAVALLWAGPMGLYIAFCDRLATGPCNYSPWPQIYEFTVRHQLALLIASIIYGVCVLLVFQTEVEGELRKVSLARITGRVSFIAIALFVYAYFQFR